MADSDDADSRAWYAAYYARQGMDRNDILSNPGVLFQALAFEVATTRALQGLPIDRTKARLLDVGCGGGTSLKSFLKLGFCPFNFSGVDIYGDRLSEARMMLPSADFREESAEKMSFVADWFDLVFEWTMFVQITDEAQAKAIAAEMIRVTRPEGYIVLVDWRYSKPRDPTYLGLSESRVQSLFRVGDQTEFVKRENGALVPPVGRWLSAHCSSFYFLVQRLLPFLVGQQTTVLRKVSTLVQPSLKPR